MAKTRYADFARARRAVKRYVRKKRRELASFSDGGGRYLEAGDEFFSKGLNVVGLYRAGAPHQTRDSKSYAAGVLIPMEVLEGCFTDDGQSFHKIYKAIDDLAYAVNDGNTSFLYEKDQCAAVEYRGIDW